MAKEKILSIRMDDETKNEMDEKFASAAKVLGTDAKDVIIKEAFSAFENRSLRERFPEDSAEIDEFNRAFEKMKNAYKKALDEKKEAEEKASEEIKSEIEAVRSANTTLTLKLTAPHGKPWGFSDGILQKAYNRTALFRERNSADFSTSVFLPEQLT